MFVLCFSREIRTITTTVFT